MAAFRVGQRVRLTWKRTVSTTNTPIGAEGVVILVGPFSVVDRVEPGRVVSVASDLLIRFGSERPSLCVRGQVEPIQPEGHQPAKWEDCMWQPSAELLAECIA